MSAFKRRISAKQPPPPPGTRTSPGSTSTIIVSTGIPSLDDILGGGLPLSCSLLVLAPDVHSAYGELVLKYFAAQGLASGQRLCVVDPAPDAFLSECMWIPGQSAPGPEKESDAAGQGAKAGDDEEDEKATEHDAKIKIAWRYEQMKQFQTTVSSSNQSTGEDYCRTFDLTSRIPESIIRSTTASGHLVPLAVSSESKGSACRDVLARLGTLLDEVDPGGSPQIPVRICIPSLGSYGWGDVTPQEICFFLHSLRALLRRHSNVSAAISMPPPLCVETWGSRGWIKRLGFLTDACVSLTAFTGDPSLTEAFSAHHGFVHIYSLPAPHTLLPPSDKFSTLRGLTSSGENNLAFKCMRKRLIFETLHLDVEGGVGERRTTPSTTATVLDVDATHRHSHDAPAASKGGDVAAIEVRLEQVQPMLLPVPSVPVILAEAPPDTPGKRVKVKKKVAFTSERPDLYDF